MNVLFYLQMNKILENGLCEQIHRGHIHLGKGAEDRIPRIIRNVMKTTIILTQNILHLSV